MSAKKLTTSTTTSNSLSPLFKLFQNSNFCLIFKESCLKQKNATFTPPNIIIFFLVYELDTWPRDLNPDFTLFGGDKLAKNGDPDKYVYRDYSIAFDFAFRIFIT